MNSGEQGNLKEIVLEIANFGIMQFSKSTFAKTFRLTSANDFSLSLHEAKFC